MKCFAGSLGSLINSGALNLGGFLLPLVKSPIPFLGSILPAIPPQKALSYPGDHRPFPPGMCVPLGLLRVHQRADTIPSFSLATVTARPPPRLTAPEARQKGSWRRPGSPRAPEPLQASRIPGSLVPEPLESGESARAAAEAGAQGVAARPGEAFHRGATSDRRSLGPGSPDPRSLEGCAPREPLRRRPTVLPGTPAQHSPRRATAGTRCDPGRARFLRADTGSPQPHARPARASCTHVRARARGDPAPAARCCPCHCCRPRPLASLPQASD